MGGLVNVMEPCCSTGGAVTTIVGIEGTKAEFNAAVTDGDPLYVGDPTMAIGGAITGATNNRILQSGATGLLENQPTWYFDDLAFGAGMTTRQSLRTISGTSGFIASLDGGVLLGRADSGGALFVGEFNGLGPVIASNAALRFGYNINDYRVSDIALFRASATQLKITDSAGTTNLDLAVRTLQLSSYTVATLPAGVVATCAFVTDETTGVFRATLVGGGAIEGPAHYANGQWRNG